MVNLINPKQNLIGRKFGRLIVKDIISIDDTPSRNHKWITLCDCGNEKKTNTYCLKYNKTMSCGCLQKEMFLKSSVKYTNDIALNGLVYEYKLSAKNRNLDFDLTHEYLNSLFSEKCYYCGIEPFCIKKVNKHSITYNGVDRVDNNKGYVMGNVVTCCKICNVAKHNMTYDSFINWIRNIVSNLSEKNLL